MSESKDTKGKVFIPLGIKTQIDYLHSQCKNKEWSGILIYKKTSGDFQKKEDFLFEVLGIYPMNIGSHSYTEYDYGNHIAKIYDVFDDIEVVRTGMIHSHHNMSAFFSGVDMDELKTNCKNHNLYLSLIVNFDEKYVAKAAIPSKTSVIRSYEILDDKGNKLTFSDEKIESDIFILDLDVEIESKNFSVDDWFKERFDEVEEEYTKPKYKYPASTGYGTEYGYGLGYNSSPNKVETKTPVQRQLFDDNYRRDWDDWDGPVYDGRGNKLADTLQDHTSSKTKELPEEAYGTIEDSYGVDLIRFVKDFLNFFLEEPKGTALEAAKKLSTSPIPEDMTEEKLKTLIGNNLDKAWKLNFQDGLMEDADIYLIYAIIEDLEAEAREVDGHKDVTENLLFEIQDLLYFTFLEKV